MSSDMFTDDPLEAPTQPIMQAEPAVLVAGTRKVGS